MTTEGGRLARLGFADVAGARPGLGAAGRPGAARRHPGRRARGRRRPRPRAGRRWPGSSTRCPRRERAGRSARRWSPRTARRERLLAVLGASAALGDHLARHPGALAGAGRRPRRHRPGRRAAALRAELLGAVDGPGDGVEPLDALRVAYRRRLLSLAARDLSGAVVGRGRRRRAGRPGRRDAGRGARDGAGRAAAGRRAGPAGRHRARQVRRRASSTTSATSTWSSWPSPRTAATRRPRWRRRPTLAGALMRACSAQTAEGTIWPVDANLRPEGRSGALVRTLASHVAYYERWAQTWEFQALLKARPVAGDLELGRRYVDALGAAGVDRRAAPGLRGRRAGDAPPGRGEHPGARRRPRAEARARAACATSSSRSSCCSSCTAAATSSSAAPRRWSRWSSCPRTGTSAGPTPPSWTARTGSCARWSTGSSCTGCAAPTSCRRTRPTCGGSPGRWGSGATRPPS